jgi:hypothetical protein
MGDIMKRNRKRIRTLFRKLEDQEWVERSIVMEEHCKKWREIQIRKEELCERRLGHEFSPLPVNGWNRPRLDGTWPERCWICDKER